GACRHEIDPLTGRADTARHAARDVELLKDANLNYIRTAHYPPTRELLDAADRLGMYVEVEAPFCWVHGEGDADDLGAVLTPTSAMIDYCHHHPSVILWSVANESQFNSLFEASAEVCKDLDPTRPTTFNNPDPKRICDIANLHYAPMPYDQHLEGDPRPIILGEYNFPVCHEQTDVRINPGLRELWGHGHGIPDSYWGWACAQSFEGPHLRPGTPPGTWSHITRSERIVGGAIWAAFDEPFYLPDGRDVGYAWRHGFWGLIDAWRRPKPEWWLAKLIFSPVWFPERRVRLSEGATAVVVPVENRYTFTELGELEFTWRMGSRAGRLTVDAPPGSTGEVEIPIPPDVEQGDLAIIDVHDAAGALVTVAAIQLGDPRPGTIPIPNAGPPSHSLANGKWKNEGDRYGFSIDAESAEFEVDSDARRASVLDFPALHLTRYDFADLAPNEKPYEVLPRAETRVVESVAVQEEGTCLAITVRDRYEGFDGSTTWRIDRSGVGEISYDYAYHGEELNAREIGVRLTLPESCDELQWRRWSEWGVYPEDSISRTEGVAKARRDPALGESRRGVRPDWPWSLDETELGTNDFRSVKLNIYEAALRSATGAGVGVRASADAHVRACLDGNGVKLHLLKECRLGPVVLRDGDRLAGRSAVQLLAP
ncbi:MAG TPA: glycoside hydrolase family 2 TIM barrel-domain containing protein, partial [Armatimonadota bacterium]|nr:glycoside hydrolase family 2 TIM barrel-domain containing protein [Armatimonadota bacterium]